MVRASQFTKLIVVSVTALSLCSCAAISASSLLPYPRHPQARQAVERLLSDDPQLKGEARVELIALGGGAIPAVIESYPKASPDTKLVMLDVVTKVGEPTPLVLNIFRAASQEQTPALRQFVAYHASFFPQLAPQMAPILQPLIDDEAPTVSSAAITTLGSFAPPDTVTSERLAQLMLKDNLQILSAATAIAINRPDERLQRLARASLSKLVGGLQDPSPPVRAAVIFAIGRFGPLAAPAVPPLSEVLAHDPVPELQFQAALALNKIGTREALEVARPKLEQFALGPDPTMAAAAQAILLKPLGSTRVQQPVVQQPQPLANEGQ